MHKDKGIHCSVRNQFGSHYGLAERGWCAQDAFVMSERLMYGLGLVVTEISLKLHLNRFAGIAFVANYHANAMLLQQFAHLLQAASWQSEMLSELFAAGDDARFIPGRKAHRLGFVELRILKRRDPDHPVKHWLGRPVFGTYIRLLRTI